MITLTLGDNIKIMTELLAEKTSANCIYADCIYENEDFLWSQFCYELLEPNGIFYIHTDYHTVSKWKWYLDGLFGKENFINWIITIQEWGGTSKRSFPRKHDDILMYSKGPNYKFYPERIQIPKVTAGTNLDKRGTGLKTPCDVFYDLGNFPTTSRERVKDTTGKNIQWQKPLKLFDRILRVCTDDNDLILDPFMGSGTTGVWCKLNNRDYIGIENNPNIFSIAKKRVNNT